MSARHHGFVPTVGDRPEAWRDNLQLFTERQARIDRWVSVGLVLMIVLGAWVLTGGLR